MIYLLPTPVPTEQVQESWAENWRQVWRNNVASTAFILVRYAGANCSFFESGSGFIVGQDLVATNGHVVQASQVDRSCGTMTLTQVSIWFAVDSRGDTLHNERDADVSVVTQIDRSVASQIDIAIISAPTLTRAPVTISARDPSPDKLQEGGVRLAEEVLQIGYSGGSTFAHFALGRINAIQKASSSSRGFLASFIADGLIASGTTVYEYDLVSGGGASGSPIFDEKGEVIAINFAGNTKDADTEFGYGVIAKGLRDLLASPRVWQSISGSL